MKKTFLAIAVAAMTTGSQAAEVYTSDSASLEIGGRAEGRVVFTNRKAEDKSRARLSIAGKTDITDSVYGLGFYEGEFISHDDGFKTNSTRSALEHRYLYAGIGGVFGELTYGKTQGALMALTDFTDIMQVHGAQGLYKMSIADKADNMMAYKQSLGMVDLRATYRFADAQDKDKLIHDGKTYDNHADGYTASGIINLPHDIKIGLGYAKGTELELETVRINNHFSLNVEQTEREQKMLTSSIALDNLYLAAGYVRGEDTLKEVNGHEVENSIVRKTDGIELAASYRLDSFLLSAAYNQKKDKYIVDGFSAKDKKEYLAFETRYDFSDNFIGFVSYQFNLSDDVKMPTPDGTEKMANKAEDQIGVGMKYTF